MGEKRWVIKVKSMSENLVPWKLCKKYWWKNMGEKKYV